MIEKISLARIAPKYAKARKADSKALARIHNLKFFREERKFFDSADKLGNYINDWSLKVIPELCNSLYHFTKMISQKAKSLHYSKK